MEGSVCVVFGVCVVGRGVGGESGENFPLCLGNKGMGYDFGLRDWLTLGRRL